MSSNDITPNTPKNIISNTSNFNTSNNITENSRKISGKDYSLI